MTTELSAEERKILDRYINRKNTPIQITPKAKKSIVENEFDFSITNLVKNGQWFYDGTKNGDKYVGLPLSLEKAQKFIKENGGVIATMPYLIAGKANAYTKNNLNVRVRDDSNYLWKDWYTAQTEEDVGIDENGLYVPRGKPILITLHGEGFLTAEITTKAYATGLTPQNAAKLSQKDITVFLKEGILPSGNKISIYSIDDVKNNSILNPFGRYAIISSFEKVKTLESKQFLEMEFLDNPLVLARAGTSKYLKEYYDLAHDDDGVGCYHRFNEIDPNVAQGRLLFLDGSYGGLVGYYYLDYSGRFVGVAPEAHRAKK